MDKIVVVAGPTASGKSALAVAIAKALDGEVISADSMQLYRGMDIGTAKVTAEEMDGVPHHMIDVAEPWEGWSAARYAEEADPILQSILQRGKTAVIAGGTGLYIDALITGKQFAPQSDPLRRAALERQADELGMERMLETLREIDPDCAQRLHPADRKRILRALEVWQETGKTMTEHDRETQMIPDKYSPLWLGLTWEPRQILYDRIEKRVDQMLEQGLLAEIQGLLDAGVPQNATALQAIGYKEFLPVLAGEVPLSQAAEQVKLGSRRYAKRQLTWFRRKATLHWIVRRQGQPFSETLDAALRQIPFFDGDG